MRNRLRNSARGSNSILNSILKSHLYKQAFFLLLQLWIPAGLGILFWGFATRLFNPHYVGINFTILSYMNIIVSISFLAIDTGLIRFIPESKDDPIFLIRFSFLIVTIALFISVILFVFVILLFNLDLISLIYNEPLVIILLILFSLVFCYETIQFGIFQAYRKSQYFFLEDFTSSLLKLLFLPFSVFSIYGIFYSYGVSRFLSLIIFSILMYSLIKKKESNTKFTENKREKSLIKTEFFRYCVKNQLSFIFYTLPAFLFPILISILASYEVTAHFSICWTIAIIIFGVGVAISNAFLIEGSIDEENVKVNLGKVLKIIIFVLIIIVILLSLFSSIILSFFGQSYVTGGRAILIILLLSSFPYSINFLQASINRVHKEIERNILMYLIISLISIVGGVLIFPVFKEISFALSWLLSHTLVSLYSLVKIIQKMWNSTGGNK